MKVFKVVSEFDLKGRKILTLDKPQTSDEYRTTHIICENKKFAYGLTHNDYLIWVESDKSLLGKEIYFTA